MSQSNAFFGTEKPLRLFMRVALPGMFSMLAMSVYGIIEGIFVGQFLGESAFAALTIAFPFVMINFSLADLVGVGSSVPISIALGRKNTDTANNLFTSSLILIFLAALLMSVILFFGSPLFVTLVGAEGEVREMAITYVRIYAIFGPFTTVVFAMDNYLRISGFVKGSMVLNIFMSCLTIGLIALFIGVLKMSIEGAALATVLSMLICAVIAFIPFLRGRTVFKFVRPCISFDMIKEIAACGSPTFLNNISGRLAAIIMNGALLRIGGAELGETAVAAYAVVMYAGEIIQPMIYGLSDSTQPAIGYNWGRRSLDRVAAIEKCAFAACGIVSVIGTAVMLFFPGALATLFVRADEIALFELSVHAMRLFSAAYLFRWVGFTVQGFYGAIEKPLHASVISLCSAFVFPVLFILLLTPLGLDGLWLNMPATAISVAVLSLVMLRLSQRNMKSDIMNAKTFGE